ncbi:MAG TPA: hypothetical protein VKU01_13995 [Bryobacteraceae bacterium]|nr:hypothetical protein [Bryobacteraceae bacterium]
MKPEDYSERTVEVDGWPVHLVTYRLEGKYHCKADNVSPGANLARIVADTREEAEDKALARAKELLGRTRRHPVQ